ncbi:MAG: polysaccharide biosynthesis/export family protein, partial [Planctomycetota bacterium]
MEKPTTTSLCFLLLTGMIFSAGCDNKFWDPMQVGRFRPVPSVNVILDSLGVAEETESVWEGAEEPRPADLMVYETDYTFGSGDVVRITIFELHQEGGLFANEYVVTETGKISIPEVGIIETGGLTEAQLEEEIKQILDPGILKDPLVSVTLISSQQRTFSILGDGVPGPSRYSIPRYDFRLTDALAQAGGIRQFNVSYIYVSRSISSNESAVEPIALQTRELESIKPQAEYAWSENNLLITSSEMITDADLTNAATPEGFELPAVQQRQTIEPEKTPLSEPKTGVRETIAPATQPQQAGQIEWVFKDGKWVPTQAGQPVSKPEPRKIARVPEKTLDEELAWDELGTSAPQSRVIEIPADKLRGGD